MSERVPVDVPVPVPAPVDDEATEDEDDKPLRQKRARTSSSASNKRGKEAKVAKKSKPRAAVAKKQNGEIKQAEAKSSTAAGSLVEQPGLGNMLRARVGGAASELVKSLQRRLQISDLVLWVGGKVNGHLILDGEFGPFSAEQLDRGKREYFAVRKQLFVKMHAILSAPDCDDHVDQRVRLLLCVSNLASKQSLLNYIFCWLVIFDAVLEDSFKLPLNNHFVSIGPLILPGACQFSSGERYWMLCRGEYGPFDAWRVENGRQRLLLLEQLRWKRQVVLLDACNAPQLSGASRASKVWLIERHLRQKMPSILHLTEVEIEAGRQELFSISLRLLERSMRERLCL